MISDIETVKKYLLRLQDQICSALEEEDGAARFNAGAGGLARPRVLSQGSVFERAAVNFSHSVGGRLPTAASDQLSQLKGAPFEAVSLSLIVHPLNPYVPTAHANLRYFVVTGETEHPAWWFGGGFDLTPYYGFKEDAVHWHQMARAACVPFGKDVYRRYKEACDRYFYLPHRGEARGIGGLFFDDLNEGGFERC
ncbi:MAG: coproporphyrinogen III oxidase, partial [Thermoanaerobaculia bacterium]